MDFQFSQEEEAFRQEIRQFLKEELPPDWLGPLSYEDEHESDEMWAFSRHMARKLADKGWLTLGWPKEYGGLAEPTMKQVILAEEMSYHRVPGIDSTAIRMLAPTLILYGTEEQKKKYLGSISKGEIVWSQGFSEPEAGSDLASLQTRAREDGDYFIVNGQKVWTSGGHRADWCFFLARTDTEAPKHKGISFFLVDLKTPGITVRPLLNIVGGASFCEVFFDNVKVPKENLVGGKNQGWYLAMSLVSFERSLIWIERAAGSKRLLEELVAYAKETPRGGETLASNSLVRQRLAEMAIEIEIARLLAYRVAWLESKGAVPEYEAAMCKLCGSEMMQHLGNVGMQLLGLYGQLERGSKWAALKGTVEYWYLSTLGRTIAGGTSEIQRNIIALRGLGLPRG